MEPSGCKRSQTGRPAKRLRQAKIVAVGCDELVTPGPVGLSGRPVFRKSLRRRGATMLDEMRPSVKALVFTRLAMIVAVGAVVATSARDQTAVGALTAAGSDCYTRAINWTGELDARTPTRLRILVRANVRWVRICGRRWLASATITNAWTKALWWSHWLSLQPRFSRKHPQEQLHPRSNATFFRPAPPHVLKPHQRWVGTFGGRSLPLPGDELDVGIALFSNDALRCDCLGIGFESPWFPRHR
jgi:hypothetical protein